jgi:hypothetical protein
MRSIAAFLVAAFASLLVAVHAHGDDGAPWTGDWDLTWSAGSAHARLIQTGDTVSGEVLLVGSKIEGKIAGDRFTGARIEAGRAHELVLLLESSGEALVGYDNSRGWVSAIRITSDAIPPAPSLESPRAAFAEFTFVANQLRLGLDGYWNRVIGSVEFAVTRYGTPLVVVLGHSQCGAILATIEELRAPAAGQSRNLMSIVDRVRPSVETLLATDLRHDHDQLVQQSVRANVRASVNQLRHGSPIIEQFIAESRLLVVGAEYSLESGRVEFFEGIPKTTSA